jgi:glucose-6-phosphate 1-epimerase
LKQLPIQCIQIGDLPALKINNHLASAVVLLQGGQLIQFQPHGADPLLWENPDAQFQHGKAVRTGIPICWPWFGDLSCNPKPVQDEFQKLPVHPAHGFARTGTWGLCDFKSHESGTTLSLALLDSPAASPLHLKLEIEVGEKLTLRLITHNHSQKAVHFSQALHSYFPTQNISETSIHGLDACEYLDAMDGWKKKHQTGPVTFTEETDRVYLGDVENLKIMQGNVQKPEAQNTLIKSSGSASCVVWNPWKEKAAHLSQFSPEAYQSMLCVETANAASDSIKLATGASHTLSLSLSKLA